MSVGRMSYESGMFRQAIQHFQRALNLVEEKKLPNELLSQTLVNLAKTLGSLGRFDEGERLLRQALSLDELEAGVDSDFQIELIEDYHQFSLLYWRAGKHDLSEQALKKAFGILAQCPEIPDELTAKLLKHRAALAQLSGDYKLCEKSVDEALDFISGSPELGKYSSIYGDCLMVKVMLLTELDRYFEALAIYREAKQILDITRGFAHPKMLELLEAMTDLAERKGLNEAAAKLQEEVREIKALLRAREEY